MKKEHKKHTIRPVLIIYPALYSLLILNYLVYIKKVNFKGIILSTGHIKMRGVKLSFPESSYFILRKTGLRYATYLLFQIRFNQVFIWLWRLTALFTKRKLMLKTFPEIIKDTNIPIFKSEEINNQMAVDFMNSVDCNLIISTYNNQILRYRTCKKFEYKAAGVHNSLLPDFGGLDAAFENLFHQVKTAGVTAHLINKGIDTGDIIVQKKISVEPKDTVFSLNVRQWVTGAQLIPDLIADYEKGDVKTTPQDLSKKKYPYMSFPARSRVRELYKMQKACIHLKDFFTPNDYIYNLFKE